MYQIYKSNIVFLDDKTGDIEKILPTEEAVGNYPEIRHLIYQNQRTDDAGYTDFCVGCDKLDFIVQGFCKPCWDMTGLEYEY